MSARSVVLLAHENADDHHFDWMLDDPAAPPLRGKLMTFRVMLSSTEWSFPDMFTGERLADHRRAYLTYEGPLTGNRGSVTRVDQGVYHPRLFTPRRFVVDLAMQHFRGTIEATHLQHADWLLRVIG